MFDASLCARLLIEDLSVAHPENWEAISERTAAIDAYLARSRGGAASADELASGLGIDRRTFYRLLAHRRSRLAGRDARSRVATEKRRQCAGDDEIIRAALAEAGLGAREGQVLDAALRIADASGQRHPSEGVVRNRFAKLKRPLALSVRLRQNYGTLLDACRLGVDTPGRDGSPAATWLVAAMDIRAGRVMAHAVAPAEHLKDEIITLAKAVVQLEGDGVEHEAVIATTALRDVAEHLGTVRRVRLCASSELRAGEGLQTIFGQRLGRVPLRKKNTATPQPVAQLATLRSVVNQLIADEGAA